MLLIFSGKIRCPNGQKRAGIIRLFFDPTASRKLLHLHKCPSCAIIPRVARLHGNDPVCEEGSVCFVKQFSYVLTKPHALHGKPVVEMLKNLSRFSSSIHLALGDQLVGLKQARLLTKADSGSKVTVTVDGKDEEAAVAAIQSYFVANM